MFSSLRGGYHTHQLDNGATTADPNLDVSPLIHNNVVVEPPEFGFIRTKTWEYDEFTGRIALGHFNAGETFTVSYRLSAQVLSEFPGFQTSAAAAINDPFFLSSDPLPQFEFFQIEQVPEPAEVTQLIYGAGVLGLLFRGRRT